MHNYLLFMLMTQTSMMLGRVLMLATLDYPRRERRRGDAWEVVWNAGVLIWTVYLLAR